MTRAEIASLEAYPLRFDLPDDLLRRMLHGGERKYFQEGYERAEKDLALTWEDVKNLDYLMNDVEFENKRADTAGKDIPFNSDESFYGEILKRFNEQRKK